MTPIHHSCPSPLRKIAARFLLSGYCLSVLACAGSLPTREDRANPAFQIMGEGKIPGEVLALFLREGNLQIPADGAVEMALLYIEEAEAEGVNPELAFVQMCLETGFLKFGGSTRAHQYNFAGLGAVTASHRGEKFPSPRIGVRAHIQHLKAYASTAPLARENVDPRFRHVRRGCCPTIFDLTGTWSTDRHYAQKLKALLIRLYEFR